MEIFVENSIKIFLTKFFLKENILRTIKKYFALFWTLKSRLLVKNLIGIAKKPDFHIKIYILPPTQANLHQKQQFSITFHNFEYLIL